MTSGHGGVLGVRTAFECPWLKVLQAEVGPNPSPSTWYYLDHPGCALVLPVTTDGHVALIRVWRVAVRQWCLEAPAGRIDTGELPVSAARRELSEEVGGSAAALVPLGEVFVSAGSSNERVHMFLGFGVTLGSARPDADEHLTLELVTVAQALHLARSGQITDSATALAIFLARDRGLLPDAGER